MGVFSPGWAQTRKGCEGETLSLSVGAGPHLDVLYHDVVSKAVRLQVSFDVFQFRERNPHVHREAGPGWATPEIHLGHKGEKTIGTRITYPAGTQRTDDLLLYG